MKPKFLAQDSHKKVRVKERWRKPRGSDSKMRKQLKGYRVIVKTGYMSPRETRGQKAGTLICSISDIKGLDQKSARLLLSSRLGMRKRIELVKLLSEKGFTIINVKDPIGYIKNHEESMNKKKEEKVKAAKDKEKKETERKKVQDKKKGDGLAEKIQTEEEKKLQDKKDKDKLLISTE